MLGPSFDALRPFARNLDEMNSAVRGLATAETPVLENEIRPFVRAARPSIDDLDQAAREYASAAPRLTTVANKVNRLGNMAAFNPDGAEPAGTAGRDEGYLYWAAWLGHNGNTVFSAGDGNGFYRRIYFTAGCDQLVNIVKSEAAGPLNPVLQIVTGLTDPVLADTLPPDLSLRCRSKLHQSDAS